MEVLLKNMIPVRKNFKKEGFKQNNGKEILTKEISDNLEIILEINDDFSKINIDVIDKNTNEKFQPFYINNSSSYLGKIKKEIEELIKKVKTTCFIENKIKTKLLNYCKNNFESIIEKPWDKWPEYQTIKSASNEKWYAVFINIPFNKLKQTSISTEEVDVLNLKLDPEEIKNLIDNVNYFAGYHMNRKYWISVYLNNKIDISKVKKLIQQSYQIVTKQK